MHFYIALLFFASITQSSLTFAGSAEPIHANPFISALPDVFVAGTRTTDQIQSEYPARYARHQRDLGNLVMQRFQQTKPSTGGAGLNDSQEYRESSLWDAVKNKFVPGIHDLFVAADKIGVDPKSVLVAVMTENTLATNNKSKRVAGLDTGVSNNDLKTADQWAASVLNHAKGGYKNYADQVRSCDKGEGNYHIRGTNKFLQQIGLSDNPECSACKQFDYTYRYLCYWAFIGELKMPGFFASSYGPAQLHMESAISVADVPNLYGAQGVFGRNFPGSQEELYQDLEDRMLTWPGAIAIVAGMIKQGERKFLDKGWDISRDYPVQTTLYHIGNVGYHAAAAVPPGNNSYYPTSDHFGTYSVLLYAVASRIVDMGREVEAGKRKWDMNELQNLIHRIP